MKFKKNLILLVKCFLLVNDALNEVQIFSNTVLIEIYLIHLEQKQDCCSHETINFKATAMFEHGAFSHCQTHCCFFFVFFQLISFYFPFSARNSIKIYLNTNGNMRGKCSLSYTSKRKTTFSSNSDNVICYQIQPDSDSYSTISDPHVISSKKLSVGLRR